MTTAPGRSVPELCGNCHSVLGAGDTFCGTCGHRVPGRPGAPLMAPVPGQVRPVATAGYPGPGLLAGVRPARHNTRIPKMAGGLSMIIVAILGMFIPWLSVEGTRFSISQAHSLCNSALGQLAQGFSSGASVDCGLVTGGYYAFIVIAIAGVALIIWGLVTPRVPGRPQQLPGYPAQPSVTEIQKPSGYR